MVMPPTSPLQFVAPQDSTFNYKRIVGTYWNTCDRPRMGGTGDFPEAISALEELSTVAVIVVIPYSTHTSLLAAATAEGMDCFAIVETPVFEGGSHSKLNLIEPVSEMGPPPELVVPLPQAEQREKKKTKRELQNIKCKSYFVIYRLHFPPSRYLLIHSWHYEIFLPSIVYISRTRSRTTTPAAASSSPSGSRNSNAPYDQKS